MKSAVNKSSKSKNSNSTDDKLLSETFERDQDLVSIGVFEKIKGKVKLVDRLIDNAYLKGYKLDSDYLRIVNEKLKFPLAKVFSGDTILRNRSLPKGAPLLTIGIPLAKDKLGKITQVILADIRLH